MNTHTHTRARAHTHMQARSHQRCNTRARAQSEGLGRAMRSLEMPLIRVLAAMETRGVGLDLGVLGASRGALYKQMGRLQVGAAARAGSGAARAPRGGCSGAVRTCALQSTVWRECGHGCIPEHCCGGSLKPAADATPHVAKQNAPAPCPAPPGSQKQGEAIAGGKLPWSKPADISDLLFKKLQLPPPPKPDKTKCAGPEGGRASLPQGAVQAFAQGVVAAVLWVGRVGGV